MVQPEDTLGNNCCALLVVKRHVKVVHVEENPGQRAVTLGDARVHRAINGNEDVQRLLQVCRGLMK